MNFLEKMRAIRGQEIETAKRKIPPSKLRKGLKKANHSFAKALVRRGKVAIIAEFKRSSPSGGEINENADLKQFIEIYDRYADAISVLTETEFFSGSLDDLKLARKFSKKPILRKDFIIDEYQIFEARRAGADAILLIAGLLERAQIDNFIGIADKLGMDCLVECFDEPGLEVVIASKARIIGINNRNLITMEENFGNAEKFIEIIPQLRRKKSVIVSESSVHSRMQLDSLKGKADAVLVGSAIMSAASPKAKLKELSGRTLVKICGTTNEKDALDAVSLGADMIGLNFYEKSPRFVNVEAAKKISDAIGGKAVVCGVFVNERMGHIEMIAREVGLDMLQFSGDESAQYVNSFSMPVIKAFHMQDKSSLDNAKDYGTKMIMLDSFSPGLYGGTGKQFDQGLIAPDKPHGKQLVFSGGLDARNVKGIIRKFRPFMVDICSGVEEKPGKKSYSKMKSFIGAVEGACK